jgi:transcriptional regulator with XRE-family HTH domain
LGRELQQQRVNAGLTGGEVAQRTGWSPSTISRIETGQLAIERVDLIQYLVSCGIGRLQTLELLEPYRDAEHNLGFWLSPQGDWLEDSLNSLIYHEATANKSTIYQPQLVHGLLQTPDYARARIGAERWRSAEDVDRCVRIRMDRQHILNVPAPASFTFFLHEGRCAARWVVLRSCTSSYCKSFC